MFLNKFLEFKPKTRKIYCNTDSSDQKRKHTSVLSLTDETTAETTDETGVGSSEETTPSLCCCRCNRRLLHFDGEPFLWLPGHSDHSPSSSSSSSSRHGKRQTEEPGEGGKEVKEEGKESQEANSTLLLLERDEQDDDENEDDAGVKEWKFCSFSLILSWWWCPLDYFGMVSLKEWKSSNKSKDMLLFFLFSRPWQVMLLGVKMVEFHLSSFLFCCRVMWYLDWMTNLLNIIRLFVWMTSYHLKILDEES